MEALTRLRVERGWSQQRLADESEVNKATINQIEKGRRSPNVETLEKLAKALNAEVADFFPKGQAPLPFHNAERRAEVERLEARIIEVAGEVEQEVEQVIPAPDDPHLFDGRAVYAWSSALNREYRLLEERRDELRPRPGEEAVILDGALSRLWQALEAGRARAEERGTSWDRGLEDLPAEQPPRLRIGGE